MIQTKEENPTGLHQRYLIHKIVSTESKPDGTIQYTTKSIDKDAEYFILRLDEGGKDPIHIAACRKAVLTYAEEIKNHLPDLAKDLIEKYSPKTEADILKDKLRSINTDYIKKLTKLLREDPNATESDIKYTNLDEYLQEVLEKDENIIHGIIVALEKYLEK
jgi:hypothetical protein